MIVNLCGSGTIYGYLKYLPGINVLIMSEPVYFHNIKNRIANIGVGGSHAGSNLPKRITPMHLNGNIFFMGRPCPTQLGKRRGKKNGNDKKPDPP